MLPSDFNNDRVALRRFLQREADLRGAMDERVKGPDARMTRALAKEKRAMERGRRADPGRELAGLNPPVLGTAGERESPKERKATAARLRARLQKRRSVKKVQESTVDLTKKSKEKFSVGQRVTVRGKMGRQFGKAHIPVKGKIVSIEKQSSGDVLLTVDWTGRMDMRQSKILGSKVKVKK